MTAASLPWKQPYLSETDAGSLTSYSRPRDISASPSLFIFFDPDRLYSDDSFTELYQELNQLERLQIDWDSYGAPAPNAQSLAHARMILDILNDQNFPPAKIDPCADGGVTITFFHGDNMAAFECFNCGDIVYGYSAGPGLTSVRNVNLDDDTITEAIEELCAKLQ